MHNKDELMNGHDFDEEEEEREEEKERVGASRRWFLQRSLIGAGIVVPIGLLASCGTQAGVQRQLGKNVLPTVTVDVTETPTAEVTETPTAEGTATETAAGTATASGTPIAQVGSTSNAFNEIMQDENQHVAFLKGAITKAGGTPRPKPTFKGLRELSVDKFAQTAQTLENVGVGAYLGALPQIISKSDQAAAASILTIEGRHAGFVGGLLGNQLSPNGAFDKPMTQDEVVKSVAPYIVDLNGGSDPAARLTTDVDVLNFALLLEYLEADFYNNNVSRLFK